MQFMVLARRRTEAYPPEAFDPQLEAEAERVRQLYAQGHLRQAWSREDTPGAVLLLEAADRSEADALLSTLPLMARGMLEVQVIALRGYRGFGPRMPA